MRDLKDYQASYEQLPFEDTQIKFRKRKILETLNRYRPRSILEIGCGLAPFFNDYIDYDFFTVVEPGEHFYENAAEHARDKNNVQVVRGTVQENCDTLNKRQYDVVLLASLLHELSDPAALLASVAMLCSAKTIVHVNVPNAKSVHRLLALEMGLIGSVYEKSGTQKKMQQSHTFDLERLTTLLNGANFNVIERGTFFIKPFTHSQMAQLQQAGVASDLLLDGLYKLSEYFPDHGSEIFMNVQLRKS
jgi:2-polyprenyl-3-methyl-5-hydroxy-6-metoxy-1,4-benzoquinol methylase